MCAQDFWRLEDVSLIIGRNWLVLIFSISQACYAILFSFDQIGKFSQTIRIQVITSSHDKREREREREGQKSVTTPLN